MVSTILEDLQRHCWGIPARSIYIGRFCRKFLDEFHLVTKLVLQENSATAGIHLRPGTSCETIWDHRRPSEIIWDYLKPSETIRGNLRLCEIIQDPLRPSETFWDHLRPSDNAHNVWHYLRPGEYNIHSMGQKVFFAVDGIILLNEGIASFQFMLQWRNNQTVTFCDRGVVL